MKMTSDGVKKMLDKLNEERETLRKNINELSFYVAAVSENEKDLAPYFDLVAANEQLEKLNMQIAKIRHARNVFNTTTVVKNTVLTIDEVLVEMAILEKDVNAFKVMATAQGKTRHASFGASKEIEYKYANFDIAEAKRIYEMKRDTLAALKQNLDYTNSTVLFEVDIVM